MILHTGHTKNRWILVHGTFARHLSWHKPNSLFRKELQENIGSEDEIVSFLWSGYNTNRARIEAAQKFVAFINKIDHTDRIFIVAHSHGANVVNLASHLSTRHIHKFFTLGVPVDIEQYMPNMNTIEWLYNIFSFGDFIQPVGGAFKRLYPEQTNITNIRIMINESHPSHLELHSHIFAKELPTLHAKIKKAQTKNPLVSCGDKQPTDIYDDVDRQKLLIQDEYVIHQLLTWFSWEQRTKKYANDFKKHKKNWAIRLGSWWPYSSQSTFKSKS